jgi:hypothetical protein
MSKPVPPFNSAKAFDANKALKSNINKLMDTAATKGLCVPLSAAYVLLVKQVNVIAMPVGMFKAQIVGAIDSASTEAFNNINNGLNLIKGAVNMVPSLQIDGSTLQALNIFKKMCLNFDDILPNAMKDMINDLVDDTNDLFGQVFELPAEVQDMIDDSIDFFYENALSKGLDDLSKEILSPLKVYREFIKSSGIIDLLKRLQKFEKCMTNPQNCGRPKKEFYFPNTKKYNSQYYMDLFAIDLKGELQMKKIVSNTKNLEKKIAKTLIKLDEFKRTPITPYKGK